MPMLRRKYGTFLSLIWERSRPATRTIPAVGSSSLMSSRMIVDLPEPVDPTRKTNSPGRIAKEVPSRPTLPGP